MECRVAPLREFLRSDLDSCGSGLCRNGSEMQSEFYDGTSSTPIAVIYDGTHPVAWSATHVWRDLQTLEGFTSEPHRRRGLARFAACGLIARGVLDTSHPVAVFSWSCYGLTRSLGFSVVRLFQREADDWVEVLK